MEEKRTIERALADSLKELVQTMSFEKVTIKKLTDGAGVTRVTFYHHFQDKYDLLEWIIRTEILQSVRIDLIKGMYREALILIFSNLQKDREFYTKVVKMQGQNSFREIVGNSVRKLLLEIFEDYAAKNKPRYPWMTPSYLADYYGESMTFVVVCWIEEGMPLSPEEMATLYNYIGTRSMTDVLREMASSKDQS